MKDSVDSNQWSNSKFFHRSFWEIKIIFIRTQDKSSVVSDRQIINYKSIITLLGEVYLIECAFLPFLPPSLCQKFFLHRSSIFRIWLREHKFLAVIRQRGMTYEYKSRYEDWREWTVDRKVEEVLNIDWLWRLVVDLGHIFTGLYPYYIL